VRGRVCLVVAGRGAAVLPTPGVPCVAGGRGAERRGFRGGWRRRGAGGCHLLLTRQWTESAFRGQGLGFEKSRSIHVKSLEGVGFRVEGLGFQVWGLGFRV